MCRAGPLADGMLEEEGGGDFGEYVEMEKEMGQPVTGIEGYCTVVDGEGAASGLNISAFSSSCGPGLPKLLPPAEAAPLPPPPPPPLEDAPVAVPKVETPSARARVTDPTDALIIARPEMWSCRLTPEDEFVLLACDGLFDVFTSEEVRGAFFGMEEGLPRAGDVEWCVHRIGFIGGLELHTVEA